MELILEKFEKRLIYEKKFLTDKQKYNEYENVLWVFLNKISFNILMNDFLYIIYCCQFLNPKKKKKIILVSSTIYIPLKSNHIDAQ